VSVKTLPERGTYCVPVQCHPLQPLTLIVCSVCAGVGRHVVEVCAAGRMCRPHRTGQGKTSDSRSYPRDRQQTFALERERERKKEIEIKFRGGGAVKGTAKKG
jgi:uncharacterized protein YfaQ (DUF2300 family)